MQKLIIRTLVMAILLLLLLLLSTTIPSLSLSLSIYAQPKPTDPSYALWWQHYFQGNVDGMNNKKIPGPSSTTI